MDPVTLLVSAVALGAAAGVKETASQVVADAYSALKNKLGRRGVDIAELELHPESVAQRVALEEALTEGGAGEDDELLSLASDVVAAVRHATPAAAAAVGIDLDDIDAEFLRVQGVRSGGSGLRIQRSRFTGGIDLSDITAANTNEHP